MAVVDQHSFNVSIEKCKILYDSGNYSLAKQLFRTLSPSCNSTQVIIETQIYLLAMGDYEFYADIDIGGNTPTSPMTQSQNTQSQNTQSQNTHSQNTHSQNTQSQNTQREDDDLVNRILVIQGSANVNTLHSEMLLRLKNSDPLARIVYALYNVGVCPFNSHDANGNVSTFPETFNSMFGTDTKNVLKGIKILEELSSNENNKHSSYIIAKIYLSLDTLFSQRYKGNIFITKSARLGHFDAQTELGALGINYDNEDQFCDHCDDGWIIIPNCSHAEKLSDKINACIGCGKVHDGSGWILCNFFLCGFKTELNSASIASYISDGFLNSLRAFDHPIRLVACLSSIAALVLQTSNDSEANKYTSLAQGLATTFTTLTLFIKKETSINNTEP